MFGSHLKNDAEGVPGKDVTCEANAAQMNPHR
jgi:hypothetical protein